MYQYTLRASAAAITAGPTAEATVRRAEHSAQVAFELDVTAVSFVGGTAPTAQVKAWIQRLLPDGASWEDVLAFQTAGLSAGGTARHSGFTTDANLAAAAPAGQQDGGGVPPFAQRVPLGEDMRLKWQIITTGAPTTFSVTFSATADA